MKKIINASLSIGILVILMSPSLNMALDSHSINVDSSVNIIDSEIQIVLSEVAVFGFVMVLLSNDVSAGWQAGMLLSAHKGESVHYFVGDPSDNTLSWSVDEIGDHHIMAGQILTFEFPEFIISSESTTSAILSILSGNYDWIPDYFEDMLDFQPFEPYLDGLTTTPDDSQKGETTTSQTSTTSTTTSTTSTSSTIISGTDDQSTSTSDSTKPTTLDDDSSSTNANPLNFSLFMFLFSMAIIVTARFNKKRFA